MDKIDKDKIRHIHLIAICGTAMGSLAGMLKQAGFVVTGSDTQVYPPMSTSLRNQGIEILEGYHPSHLDPRPDLVIVGNAVSKTNPEVEALLAREIPYLSLPQAVSRFFITGKTSIVVTGTHGKTTTTSIVATLLNEAGLDPSFLVGGILENFGKSYQLGTGPHFVIEGDEYDTAFFDKAPKFYHYQGKIVAMTSLEFDHADIFPNLATIEGHFEKLARDLPEDGILFTCGQYENLTRIGNTTRAKHVRYGISGTEALSAINIKHTPTGCHFDLIRDGVASKGWQSPLSGEHNLLNALVAIGISSHIGIPDKEIQKGLLQFKNVKRRQEVRGIKNGVVVIDDFAHHPTAVRETIRAVRKSYPKGRILAVFEPRSNSSIRALFEADYTKSLDEADVVALAPVHRPDKVKDGAVLNPEKIAAAIGQKAKAYESVEAIVAAMKILAKPDDVILVMSNGGFENIHEKLLATL